MGSGTHRLPPERLSRPIWSLGGKVNTSFFNKCSRDILLRHYKKGSNGIFTRIWLPRIAATVTHASMQLGLMTDHHGRDMVAVGPSQLAWNRAPRPLNNKTVKNRKR